MEEQMICKFCKRPALIFLSARSVMQWLLIGQCQQCQMGETYDRETSSEPPHE